MGPNSSRYMFDMPSPADYFHGMEDQAARLIEFRRAYPEWEITSPKENGTDRWFAIRNNDAGCKQLVRVYLRALLDSLDELVLSEEAATDLTQETSTGD